MKYLIILITCLLSFNSFAQEKEEKCFKEQDILSEFKSWKFLERQTDLVSDGILSAVFLRESEANTTAILLFIYPNLPVLYRELSKLIHVKIISTERIITYSRKFENIEIKDKKGKTSKHMLLTDCLTRKIEEVK